MRSDAGSNVGPFLPRRVRSVTGQPRRGVPLALAVVMALLAVPAGWVSSASAAEASDYSWVLTGGLTQPAGYAVAELVQTPDGARVLAAGGHGQGFYTASSWLYDPGSGQWIEGAPMHRIRVNGARSILLDDGRVLVVGGDSLSSGGGITDGTYELYDPAAGIWSQPYPLPVKQDLATLTKLLDGRVLIAGGTDTFQWGQWGGALLFDPVTDSITATASLNQARYGHGAALLTDGRVLVAGGEGTASTEIYDPVTQTWTPAAPMHEVRWEVGDRTPMPVLPDGRVLVVGGGSGPSAEIYDPESNTWSDTMPLTDQTTMVADLGNGLIVLSGDSGSSTVFDSATGQWSAGPPLPVSYHWGVGVLLPNGDLLATGGWSSGGQRHSLLFTTNPGERDRTPPVITITSPTGDPVDLGTTIVAEFSCADSEVEGQVASGIATCESELQDSRGHPSIISNGDIIPTPLSGVYTLSVWATDVAGFRTVERVVFPVGLQILEVTAESKTMKAGDAVPDLTFATSSDAELFEVPTCTTTGTSSSPPGTYPITCSGAYAGGLYWVTHVEGTLTIEAGDSDGVPPAVEDEVPSLGSSGGSTGDGNGDGTLDSEQVNVTSLPSTTASGQWVTLESPAGTSLSNVSTVDMAQLPEPPPSVTLPEGLTDFVVTGIPEGAPDQTISIYTASTAGLTGYAKYDEADGWAMLPAERVTIVDEHRVDITLTDGGIGDADRTPNGSIVDPGGLVFDRTAPTITVSGIEAGQTYILGATPAAACTVTDDQSGVTAPCHGVTTGGNTAGVGDFTYQATATDRAGNTTTTSVDYRVVYRFDGFGSPINDPTLTPGAARSVFKTGSTIPVRIQLKNAAGTIVTPEDAPLWVTPQKGSATNATPNESLWSQPETSGTTFTRAGDTWHYNWSSKEAEAGYTYRVSVKLDDGTTRSVVLAIR